MSKRIIISKGTELLRVPADFLMYVSPDGNYSNVVTTDGKFRLVTYSLGQIEDAINEQFGDLGVGNAVDIDGSFPTDTSETSSANYRSSMTRNVADRIMRIIFSG